MADPATGIAGALLAAAIAALGFVGKELWVIAKLHREEQRRLRGELVQLMSLLRASKASFETQIDHRNELLRRIPQKYPDVGPSNDYESSDDYFARAYDKLDDKDRKLHSIIRGITMHALRPLNQSILKWVQDDRYFKGARNPVHEPLSKPLGQLEVHLLLWLGKYETWIQDHRRALVYLDDEDQHGVAFPSGIDRQVEQALYGPQTPAAAGPSKP